MKSTAIHITAILVGCLASHLLSAQSFNPDSVELLLQRETEEADKVSILLEAAKEAYDVDKELSILYTSALLDHPLVEADSNLWMDVLRRQAAANRRIGNYVKSIEEFKTCYSYFRSHRDTVNWSFSANYLGSMHVFMGYNEQAQDYLTEVYELHKASGDTSAIAGATNGLAIFYSNINQPEKARERYEEALRLFEAVDDTLGRGNVHANLGLLLIDLEEYELAEHHLMMQGHLDTLLNTQWGLGFHFDFMGYLRRKQGRLDEAYESHLTALRIRENLESHYNISESRSHLCDILLEMGRHDEAIEQAEKILESKHLHNSLSHQQKAYRTLSQAWEALGDYRKGLDNHKIYKTLSDSIFNQDILEKVAEKDAKFDLAENRNQLALLDAKNAAAAAVIDQKTRTIWLGTAALVVFAVLSLILYILSRKYLRQRGRLTSALSDKELLLKEIHHRVKNNLQIISGLLSLQGRSVSDSGVLQAINEGKSRVRSMALIHQNLYQGTKLTGVEVKPYLEKLCEELFSTYKIDADEVSLDLQIEEISLDVDTLVPLGLIINELITNSLKYAFNVSAGEISDTLEEGTISISLFEKDKVLTLKVGDTGKGYDTDAAMNGTSFGQKLLSSLSAQLNAEMTVTSNDKGTMTVLKILKYKLV